MLLRSLFADENQWFWRVFLFENCEESPEMCRFRSLCCMAGRRSFGGHQSTADGITCLPFTIDATNVGWFPTRSGHGHLLRWDGVQGANFQLEVSTRHELDLIDYLFPAFVDVFHRSINLVYVCLCYSFSCRWNQNLLRLLHFKIVVIKAPHYEFRGSFMVIHCPEDALNLEPFPSTTLSQNQISSHPRTKARRPGNRGYGIPIVCLRICGDTQGSPCRSWLFAPASRANLL